MKYLKEFLKIAPFSLAVWRAGEAEALSKAFRDYQPQGPVLDIGCGFGEFMSVFSSEVTAEKIDVGIDICQPDLNSASSKSIYKKLICCDARDLGSLTGHFNTVTAISVLEHINNVDRVFTEVAKVLNPNGYFIFTVPTTKLDSFLWRQILHPVFLHKSLYSPKGWQDLTKSSGLTIKRIEGTISSEQLTAFEKGLPSALLTQPCRNLFKRRLPFSPELRVTVLEKLAKHYLEDGVPTKANIIVVAQKI